VTVTTAERLVKTIALMFYVRRRIGAGKESPVRISVDRLAAEEN